MRIYKPTRTTNGRSVPYAKWYVEFRDHAGILRKVSGFRDKHSTQELGRKLMLLVSCRVSGEAYSPDLSRWLEGINRQLLDKLTKIGLLDSLRVARLLYRGYTISTVDTNTSKTNWLPLAHGLVAQQKMMCVVNSPAN